MSLNKWAGFILALVLVVGFTICFKRFDYFSLNEIKALISVLFGFATSCLLLSFMWLLQNRPLQEAWSVSNSVTIDMPSMNPRGSSSSIAPRPRREGDQLRQHHGTTISFISGAHDRPPAYKDALINSKPLNWHYLESKQQQEEHLKQMKTNVVEASVLGKALAPVSAPASTVEDTVAGPAASKLGASQMTLNLVREICGSSTSLGPAASSVGGQNETEASKVAPVELSCLDVGQLPVCGSPPKYSELTFGFREEEQQQQQHQQVSPRMGHSYLSDSNKDG